MVEASTSTPRKRLDALDGARWLASAQIVLVHFYRPCKLANYGGLWTQFFFILSGFVLAYSELIREVGDSLDCGYFKYVRKRLASLYPIYFFTLMIYIVIAKFYLHHYAFWRVLPFHIFLMQAWFPICHNWHCSLAWNDVTWFISVLVIYWFFLRDLAKWFRDVSAFKCCLCLLALWAWTFALLSLQIHYSASNQFWRRSPFGYFHVFIAGVVTARLFVLTQDKGTKYIFLIRYGAVCGYLFYFLLVWFGPSKSGYPGEYHTELQGHIYFWAHNGGLLPLHVLILLGCAIGDDPLAKYVFKSDLFRILGRLSYAQYLLQHKVMDLVKYIPYLNGKEKVVFPFALLSIAYLANRFVEQPCAAWLREPGCSVRLATFLDRQLEKCAEVCCGAISKETGEDAERGQLMPLAEEPATEKTECSRNGGKASEDQC